eukprot:jgi/Psemu1/30737/gm1.30737_g
MGIAIFQQFLGLSVMLQLKIFGLGPSTDKTATTTTQPIELPTAGIKGANTARQQQQPPPQANNSGLLQSRGIVYSCSGVQPNWCKRCAGGLVYPWHLNYKHSDHQKQPQDKNKQQQKQQGRSNEATRSSQANRSKQAMKATMKHQPGAAVASFEPTDMIPFHDSNLGTRTTSMATTPQASQMEANPAEPNLPPKYNLRRTNQTPRNQKVPSSWCVPKVATSIKTLTKFAIKGVALAKTKQEDHTKTVTDDDDMEKMYQVTIGQIDDRMKAKLKDMDEWKDITKSNCVIKLIKGMETAFYVRMIKEHFEVLKSLGRTMICKNFVEYEITDKNIKFLLLKSINKAIKQRFVATIIVEGSDKDTCELKKTLANNYSLLND